MNGLIRQHKLRQWRAEASRIIQVSDDLKSLSDARLENHALELKWKALSGEPLDKMRRSAFATVREAARRAHNQSHFPVQLMGGIALFQSGIAEMQTGEGKTLTALLPSFLRALVERGCHVITSNDYLAARDAEFAGQVFQRLGISVGCIQSKQETDDRRKNYACDITYGTAKEMGFDFLRDRLRTSDGESQVLRRFSADADSSQEAPVQRGHYFALVDEADSILIDDAKTPLIIALGDEEDAAETSFYRWSIRIARQLKRDHDYLYEPSKRRTTLTAEGCRWMAIAPKPPRIQDVDLERMFRQVERAITAELGFIKDRDYVIEDGEILIVDESTGRAMPGRKWQEGLHQAVEAKEGVQVTAATQSSAKITVQSFFAKYEHLSGLTGTASQADRELKRIYGLGVSTIPTNKPCIRSSMPTRIFVDQQTKLDSIAEQVAQLQSSGRATLIGTPSVRASEQLAEVLKAADIEHQVLNCHHHQQEAEIISQAGASGQVTIATNMAGRGTDILIDESVRKNGGLHVIATEMHSSERIDRQLIGRSARQGDPGTFQFFLSLEDELFNSCDAQTIDKLQQTASGKAGELQRGWIKPFKKQQGKLVKSHTKLRKHMLKQEEERTEQYERMGLDPYLELND